VGSAFQQGKQGGHFLPFLFLVSTSQVPPLLRLRKEGELLLQHIRFLLLGRAFSSSLFGLLLLKHSEGVFYNLWEDWLFLGLWGRACERIAKNDILLSSSLGFSRCYDFVLEAARSRTQQ
jgi:hypothetical protein